jgi:large subunit ribosomal protein L5
MAKKEVKQAPAKAKKAAAEAKPFTGEPRLKVKYRETAIPGLKEKFHYENVMMIPKLDKIIINMGLGSEKDNPKGIETAVQQLSAIAGQAAVVTKAKKSVANFKVREGQNVGAKVTLRGDRMEEFMDKLVSIALPRVRDFRGVSTKAFDGRGNYALGVKEQLIFPEIEYDKVEKIRGMEMIFVTTAKTDEEAKELLSLLGMPFAR